MNGKRTAKAFAAVVVAFVAATGVMHLTHTDRADKSADPTKVISQAAPQISNASSKSETSSDATEGVVDLVANTKTAEPVASQAASSADPATTPPTSSSISDEDAASNTSQGSNAASAAQNPATKTKPQPARFVALNLRTDAPQILSGTAARGSTVIATANGQEIARATASDTGLWRMPIEKPLEGDSYILGLSSIAKDGARIPGQVALIKRDEDGTVRIAISPPATAQAFGTGGTGSATATVAPTTKPAATTQAQPETAATTRVTSKTAENAETQVDQPANETAKPKAENAAPDSGEADTNSKQTNATKTSSESAPEASTLVTPAPETQTAETPSTNGNTDSAEKPKGLFDQIADQASRLAEAASEKMDDVLGVDKPGADTDAPNDETRLADGTRSASGTGDTATTENITTSAADPDTTSQTRIASNDDAEEKVTAAPDNTADNVRASETIESPPLPSQRAEVAAADEPADNTPAQAASNDGDGDEQISAQDDGSESAQPGPAATTPAAVDKAKRATRRAEKRARNRRRQRSQRLKKKRAAARRARKKAQRQRQAAARHNASGYRRHRRHGPWAGVRVLRLGGTDRSHSGSRHIRVLRP